MKGRSGGGEDRLCAVTPSVMPERQVPPCEKGRSHSGTLPGVGYVSVGMSLGCSLEEKGRDT